MKLAMTAIGAGWFSSPAQEALRTAVESDRAYEVRNATRARPQEGRLTVGPVSLDAHLGYQLQWNDNIRSTASNMERDWIQMPRVSLRAMWPATKDSTITVGASVGYEIYHDHSELNRLNIAPDSEVAWDIPVKDFVFTLHDRIQYSQEIASQGGLSGVAQFPRLENTAGVRARWQPGDFVFEVGYDHYFLSADSETFDYLSRSSEQFFARAARCFGAITRVGMEASGSLTDYDSPDQSDNQSVSVGPFADWQIRQSLRLTLRGGYVVHFSDRGLTGGGEESLNPYYFGAEATHHLTDFVTHGVSANREVRQGYNPGSDFSEELRVRYFVTWAFHRSADLGLDAFYEEAQEPQPEVLEEYTRLGIGVSLNCRPRDHLTVGASYRFTTKESNLATRDYQQNLVTLNLDYRF